MIVIITEGKCPGLGRTGPRLKNNIKINFKELRF
jgi:hypothetical protein